MTQAWHSGRTNYRTRSVESRRGKRNSMPFLKIECPECHAPAGRRCMFPQGSYAIAHDERRDTYNHIANYLKARGWFEDGPEWRKDVPPTGSGYIALGMETAYKLELANEVL